MELISVNYLLHLYDQSRNCAKWHCESTNGGKMAVGRHKGARFVYPSLVQDGMPSVTCAGGSGSIELLVQNLKPWKKDVIWERLPKFA